MTLRNALWLGAGISVAITLYGFQRPWRLYRSMEPYDNVEMPPDWQDKSEWVFARLMYPQHPHARFGRFFGYGAGTTWLEGGTSWTQDYPRADRHFALALRRLTRVSVRSVEQPVNLDDGDDVYNWPWLNAGEMGDWKLTSSQIQKLRGDYLLRGGFLMLDDFWGTEEWERFYETMGQVFPDRAQSLKSRMPIPSFTPSTIWTIAIRSPGSGPSDAAPPIVTASMGAPSRIGAGSWTTRAASWSAMSFNSDIGDSWEWADDPEYPEKYSALGIRIGVNYVIYSLTH